ncbi:MAG: glycerol-3-phosphate dehydrogenase [Sphingomicrobium sp.]
MAGVDADNSDAGAPFDLAVIGGGVNGCGIARDAAGRGARVLLLEQGDLASGTSSASTKLIHGGLRYLEHYEFGLVREALSERETLWRIAPHIIHPLRFVLPHRKGLRPRWLLRAGLFLYDHLGGRKLLPPTRSIDLRQHVAGVPLKPGFARGWEYSDGWVDDSRLVILNARDAADRGATILPHHHLVRATREGPMWRLDAVRGDGSKVSFVAKALVNAAGPGVLDVLGLTPVANRDKIRLVRGSHIVVPRLFDHHYAYFFQLPDERVFFAIPYERDFTLIGTTDRDHDGGPIRASDEEIEYLCAGANDYFRRAVTPADVGWSFSGVRPLVDDGSGRPEAASRGYHFELDAVDGAAPLLSVFGGKITTYRKLAEAAVGRIVPLLAALSGQAWTGTAPLPGGDFAVTGRAALAETMAVNHPFLGEAEAARIAAAYGTLASAWLATARTRAELGENFGGGLSAAEVDYCMDREWARNADDMLWRRSKLGLRISPEGHAALDRYMAARGAR